MFHPPIFKYGQIHLNLRIIFWHSSQSSSRIFHPWRRSEPTLHPSRSSFYFPSFPTLLIHQGLRINFLIRQDLLITFPNFPLECIETCPLLNQFASLESSDILSSIPIQHFSDVTTPSSIHLVERLQGRNLYVVINMTGLLHKYGPRPILCLTTRRIFQSNRWIGRC